MARNGVTVNALGFFSEPLNKGSGVGDLALGFSQRLALFGGHQARQVVLVFDHQFEPTTQLARTFFGGQRTPGRQRLVGGLNGAAGFGSAHLRHSADDLAGGRVIDLDGLTVVRVQPHAIDEGLLAEQLGVFKLHVGFLKGTVQARSELLIVEKGERLKSQTNPRINEEKGQ
ncbi:hypothetical protein D3C81_1546280 [compost metagenome]